ncbi:hypothetical protein [Streptomyces sp. NPDC086787]|uniref:hypothetical protein n=1 Tax=Streptomyces sp. NPDC086787 TaxID=3365759 RepID=UPI003802409E
MDCDTTALIDAFDMANTRGDNVLDLTDHCAYSLTAADSGEDGLPAVTDDNLVIHGHNATIERAPG